MPAHTLLLSLALSFAALLAFLPASTAVAAETTATLEDGLRVQWDRKKYVSVGGRIHYDVARFDDDVTPLEDDDDFRRARITSAARFDDWRLRADYDVGIAEGWRNLYIQYRGIKDTRITLGHQVVPFSLEDIVGSNDMTMTERSLASALSPGMLTGAAVQTSSRNWTLAGGVFGDELNDQDRRELDGVSVIGRGTWAPVNQKRRVLHLGLAQEFRWVDDDNVRIRARPESRLADQRLVDTGGRDGVDDVRTTGLELMGFVNNVKVQSEYVFSTYEGDGEADFAGGYLQLSVVLTGERYRYSRSRGAPSAIRPSGRWGALEATARYSFLDLEDSGITGGEQTQGTLGLTWYPNDQLRVMLNYGRFDADPNSSGVEEDGSVMTLRLQASL